MILFYAWIFIGMFGGSCLLSFIDRHRERSIEFQVLSGFGYARAMVVLICAAFGFIMIPVIVGEAVFHLMLRDLEQEWKDFDDQD